ncbi:class C sortase [Anaerococcus sp. AGMB00486]|uniref:Class C sortase n=2 Tax=Anaerococcus TaxID=165779 RepID=A0ABX2N8Q8_9FIRM|nr:MULTISPECIES: class C sortase [Anaerococcus]MDY3006589.1 class C sortase [Anaerococcus porci]MSS77427.1 class C sortase [Anaerococcus porci]NVF11086.1 class C sortase [Anaerococcus faecalis]
MKLSKKDIRRNLPFLLIFLVGFLIFSYPFISQKFYEIEAKDEIIEFKKAKDDVSKEDLEKRMELARVYNQTLDPSIISDPYDEKVKEAKADYARMLEVHEMLGHIEIPKIAVDIPIYAGTSDDVLEKGAGHLEGTSLPIGGDSTHTVITAHRGLPNAVLFRYLNQLTEGDIFYIHNIKETLAYKVDKIQVVEPTNFDPILVVDKKDYATLLTCTPYMINSHRLLVRGERIDYAQAIDDGSANTPKIRPDFYQLFLVLIPILLFTILTYIREKHRQKKMNMEVKDIEERLKEK